MDTAPITAQKQSEQPHSRRWYCLCYHQTLPTYANLWTRVSSACWKLATLTCVRNIWQKILAKLSVDFQFWRRRGIHPLQWKLSSLDLKQLEYIQWTGENSFHPNIRKIALQSFQTMQNISAHAHTIKEASFRCQSHQETDSWDISKNYTYTTMGRPLQNILQSPLASCPLPNPKPHLPKASSRVITGEEHQKYREDQAIGKAQQAYSKEHVKER